MWAYHYFLSPHVWFHFCRFNLPLKFVGVWLKTSSDLLQKSFIGNLWQSSEIFGKFWKCWESFLWPSDSFQRIFRNLQKVVRNLSRIAKNIVIWLWEFYIIDRKLYGCLKILNFSSHVEKSFSTLKEKFCILRSHVNIFYMWINSHHASAQARSLGNTGRSSRYLRPFCIKRTLNTHSYSVSI